MCKCTLPFALDTIRIDGAGHIKGPSFAMTYYINKDMFCIYVPFRFFSEILLPYYDYKCESNLTV